MRNCIIKPKAGNQVCGESFEENGIFFDAEANAGFNCEGGVFDGKDGVDGITEVKCIDGGGSWNPYTCKDIDIWLYYWAEKAGVDDAAQEYLIDNFWSKKCCQKAN